jgi:hypothetical protein
MDLDVVAMERGEHLDLLILLQVVRMSLLWWGCPFRRSFVWIHYFAVEMLLHVAVVLLV